MTDRDLSTHTSTTGRRVLKGPDQVGCGLNTDLVREFVSFLSAHKGPDRSGRAHPRLVKLSLVEIQTAIDILHARGELTWLRPYHLSPCPNGSWRDQKIVDEVLTKKCEALLEERFKNDLTALCCLATFDDLRGPLIERVEGRDIAVSVLGLHRAFSGSPYKILCRYLELIDRQAEYSWFKPYHMTNAPKGTWQDPKYVDDVLRRKCESLRREKFQDDLTSFCRFVTLEDLESPLIETHADREIRISMNKVAKQFGCSPYDMVRRYLEIIGCKKDYTWFKPYHMTVAPNGTWQKRAILDEVLKKKCHDVLTEQFANDITSFCCSVTIAHLSSPLTERRAGQDIQVSTSSLIKAFSGSRFRMVRRYLQISGLKREAYSFRPYHMDSASRGTWKKRALSDELLRKKCDSLLKDKFSNDLISLCCSVTTEDLKSPLLERFAGRTLAISMHGLVGSFSNSPYKAVRRYLQLIGREEEFSWFKPYHMAMASLGTWLSRTLLNEILKKKCDALLKEKFSNDLTSFCCLVTAQDLTSPFIERIEGREIPVSMGAVILKFSGSPYKIVTRYLRLIGRNDEYSWLRPYHMAIAPQATWQDPKIIDEVVNKKCAALLKEKFDNDLELFSRSVRHEDIISPLIEHFGGREFSTSMAGMARYFSDSPYRVVQRYHKLSKLPFHYTPACFIGPPETRRRRQSGELSPADLRRVKRPDGTLDTSRYGFKNFTTPGKSAVRKFMLDVIEHQLQDRPVRYLGLETELFVSLRAIHGRLNLSPSESLVVERDRRTFIAMQHSVRALPHGEGKSLRQLKLACNALESELENTPAGAFRFNVANLDYFGHMSEGKEYALQLLLAKKLLEPDAMVFITLHDTELARFRAVQAGYDTDQSVAVDETLHRLASLTGHKALQVARLNYDGGSSDRSGSKMLWLAYTITHDPDDDVDAA